MYVVLVALLFRDTINDTPLFRSLLDLIPTRSTAFTNGSVVSNVLIIYNFVSLFLSFLDQTRKALQRKYSDSFVIIGLPAQNGPVGEPGST